MCDQIFRCPLWAKGVAFKGNFHLLFFNTHADSHTLGGHEETDFCVHACVYVHVWKLILNGCNLSSLNSEAVVAYHHYHHHNLFICTNNLSTF